MDFNNITNEQLGKMVEDILNGRPVDMGVNSQPGYVDERAEAFIQSLRDMVK